MNTFLRLAIVVIGLPIVIGVTYTLALNFGQAMLFGLIAGYFIHRAIASLSEK